MTKCCKRWSPFILFALDTTASTTRASAVVGSRGCRRGDDPGTWPHDHQRFAASLRAPVRKQSRAPIGRTWVRWCGRARLPSRVSPYEPSPSRSGKYGETRVGTLCARQAPHTVPRSRHVSGVVVAMAVSRRRLRAASLGRYDVAARVVR